MAQKICRVSAQKFTLEPEDLAFYAKFDVPPPTLCPDERSRRRLAWRNGRSLYSRACDATGKKIISIHREDAPYPVYDYHHWWSDKWSPLDYGQDFDFSRPFFDQFSELYRRVPQINLQNINNENADFTSYAGWNKNCYWIFYSDQNHDCCFLEDSFYCKNCLDCSSCHHCELCYQMVASSGCYNCRFLQNCENCSDSWFLKSCIGCKHCFGSLNLRNKNYYFFNEPLTKEEYFKRLEELALDTRAGLEGAQKRFFDHSSQLPHRFMVGANNESVSGNYIRNSRNLRYCFNVEDCRDCAFAYDCQKCNDCYDIDGWGGTAGAECVYEGQTVGEGAFNVAFSNYTFSGATNVYYSDLCINGCHDLFGCVGCRKEAFCILNKQYSADDYHTLREKIVAHMKATEEWGEFFPIRISPFAYNETMAHQVFPLSRAEALARGYRWIDEESGAGNPAQDSSPIMVPETIAETRDAICERTLGCEVTGRQYKIQKAELDFYRKLNIPPPRQHPNTRFEQRTKLKNPRRLVLRTCDGCKRQIQSGCQAAAEERVLCGKCYREAVE